jgi:hypothetical protein
VGVPYGPLRATAANSSRDAPPDADCLFLAIASPIKPGSSVPHPSPPKQTEPASILDAPASAPPLKPSLLLPEGGEPGLEEAGHRALEVR